MEGPPLLFCTIHDKVCTNCINLIVYGGSVVFEIHISMQVQVQAQEENKDLKAFPAAMYHIIDFNTNRTTNGDKQSRLQLC